METATCELVLRVHHTGMQLRTKQTRRYRPEDEGSYREHSSDGEYSSDEGRSSFPLYVAFRDVNSDGRLDISSKAGM